MRVTFAPEAPVLSREGFESLRNAIEVGPISLTQIEDFKPVSSPR
jgi:hypothetical protein